MNKKERTISFLWQHLWLLVSLFIMTLGVAVCVKSELGSSVISTLPYVFETAGKRGLGIPSLTIGQYTYIMNAILVAGQIAVLRRRFEPVQLFQLLVGFVFGSLIDLNMALTSWLLPDDITEQALAQIAGCTVLGIGIALEVRCGSVTMPGEGFPVAVSCVTGFDFPKIKIVVDCSLVVLAVAFCFCWIHRAFCGYNLLVNACIKYEKLFGFGTLLTPARWFVLALGAVLFALYFRRKWLVKNKKYRI